jgi:hypothetical protein
LAAPPPSSGSTGAGRLSPAAPPISPSLRILLLASSCAGNCGFAIVSRSCLGGPMVSPSHQPERCRTYQHSRIRTTCLLHATPTPTSAELDAMRPRGRCLSALIARVCSLSSHTTLRLPGSCVCCLIPPLVEVCPGGQLRQAPCRYCSPREQYLPPHKNVARVLVPDGRLPTNPHTFVALAVPPRDAPHTPHTLVALVLPERGSSLLSSVLSLLLSPQAAVLSQRVWCCPIPSVLCR